MQTHLLVHYIYVFLYQQYEHIYWTSDWQEPRDYVPNLIPKDVRNTAEVHTIQGLTNWQQPTKEHTEFCIRQLFLDPALVADVTDIVSIIFNI